jgi:hypothetical protein
MTIKLTDNVFLNKPLTRIIPPLSQWVEKITTDEEIPIKYVGGIHNLTINDKQSYTEYRKKPIRFIETNTKRQEIWFSNSASIEYQISVIDSEMVRIYPDFISLNEHDQIHSLKSAGNRLRPAISFSLVIQRLEKDGTVVAGEKTKVIIWYDNGEMGFNPNGVSSVDLLKPAWYSPTWFSGMDFVGTHHNIDKFSEMTISKERLFPVLMTKSLLLPTTNSDSCNYINGTILHGVAEMWNNEKDINSTFISINMGEICFKKSHTRIHGVEAFKWITKNCRGGFFPDGEILFPNSEDEFLFLTEFLG